MRKNKGSSSVNSFPKLWSNDLYSRNTFLFSQKTDLSKTERKRRASENRMVFTCGLNPAAFIFQGEKTFPYRKHRPVFIRPCFSGKRELSAYGKTPEDMLHTADILPSGSVTEKWSLTPELRLFLHPDVGAEPENHAMTFFSAPVFAAETPDEKTPLQEEKDPRPYIPSTARGNG